MTEKDAIISKLILSGNRIINSTEHYIIYSDNKNYLYGLIDINSRFNTTLKYSSVNITDYFYIFGYYNKEKSVYTEHILTRKDCKRLLVSLKTIKVVNDIKSSQNNWANKSNVLLVMNNRNGEYYLIHSSGKVMKITPGVVNTRTLNKQMELIPLKDGNFDNLGLFETAEIYDNISNQNNVNKLILIVDQEFNIRRVFGR